MDFSMKKLAGILVNGQYFEVEPDTSAPHVVIDGYPQRDMTAVKLPNNAYIVVKDPSVDALFFSDKEIRH